MSLPGPDGPGEHRPRHILGAVWLGRCSGPRAHFAHLPGGGGSWVLGRHLKPQAGHTLVSESAHSSSSEGLPVTDRWTQQRLQPTQRLLLWLLRTAGPSRTEQLLLWSRRVRGWPTPLLLATAQKIQPSPRGNQSPPARRRSPLLRHPRALLLH